MANMQVSDSELVLMQLIWEKGGTALFAEVIDAVGQKKLEWKYNTVLTFLSRLVEKGFLTTNKIGRRNEYKAVVSEQEYHATQTKMFVDKVYDGNVVELVSTLIAGGLVSAQEQEELRKLWKDGDGNE